jgi:FG-GAP-like repeat
LFAGASPNSLVIADFNNDGISDVAVGSSAGLGILLGKGDGTFEAAAFSDPGGITLGTAADLRGNGKVDLITGGGSVSVLLGNGDGTFQPPLPPVTGAEVSGPFVRAADVNGDGKLDLVVSPGVGVFLGNGDGTFGAGIGVLPGGGDQLFAPGSEVYLVDDFNGDKRPDLVLNTGGYGVKEALVTLLNVAGPVTPDFLIGASSLSPGIVVPGSSTGSTITLTPANGFSATVALSCLGLPSGASCGFSSASLVGGSGTSTLTVRTSASTPQGTYFVSVVGTSATVTHQRLVTLTVATSANGVTINLAPGKLAFPPAPVGTASATQSVQLMNVGPAQLAISNISVTGTNAGDFTLTSGCGSSLSAGSTCQLGVTFKPAGMGGRSAAISVIDNAAGSPQSVTLAGSGPDFSVGAGSPTSATVTPGQTASYSVGIAPVGGFAQSVALACSGAPAMATCSVSPSTISLSGTATKTVMASVTTTGSSQILPFGGGWRMGPKNRPMPLFAVWSAAGLLMLLAWRWFRRKQDARWAPTFALGILVCLGVTLTSCGGGSSGGGGGTGTQAGTYSITVTGNFSSGSTNLTHAANLTLVVQ